MTFDPHRVPVGQASTVVLCRPACDAFNVFMMQRRPTMQFAAGRMVFPGGGVDSADIRAVDHVVGSVEAWADRAGLSVSDAVVRVITAVRETFEETGVLLARPYDVTTPGRIPGESVRAELESGRVSFADILTEYRRVVNVDDMVPWSQWVTPLGPPRRYDTLFFIAQLPSGQDTAITDDGEAAHGEWVSPRDALSKFNDILLPPTQVTLREIASFSALTELLACERSCDDLAPRR